MPLIHLSHFIHGRKIANLEAEAEFDEKNGWVRYNPDEPREDEASENSLRVKRKYTRRTVEEPLSEES